MREMRRAAAAPLGWVDFTTRKCQRCRQRNPTPREKTLNQTQNNCSEKFPPKYLPKMLPNLLPHYSSFPQISPSFHILRFKRAPQLRPSHKGCGEGKFLYFFSLQNLAKLSFELLQTNNSNKLPGACNAKVGPRIVLTVKYFTFNNENI